MSPARTLEFKPSPIVMVTVAGALGVASIVTAWVLLSLPFGIATFTLVIPAAIFCVAVGMVVSAAITGPRSRVGPDGIDIRPLTARTYRIHLDWPEVGYCYLQHSKARTGITRYLCICPTPDAATRRSRLRKTYRFDLGMAAVEDADADAVIAGYRRETLGLDDRTGFRRRWTPGNPVPR